jgi:hypothetical protein
LLFGQPGNVPARDALNVPDHDLKALEVEDCACVEGDVEEDEGPFEEGVFGVCYSTKALLATDFQICRAILPVDLKMAYLLRLYALYAE